MLTIFTTIAPFEGERVNIQYNAIQSWKQFADQIILVGAQFKDVRKIAKSLGVECCFVKCDGAGTPMVDHIFHQGLKLARNFLTCYLNSDIIVIEGLAEAAEICAQRFDKFLLVGQRLEAHLDGTRLNFEEDWKQELQPYMEKAELRHWVAIDYFCTPGDIWNPIPPFSVGCRRWDNWLVGDVMQNQIPLIDVTKFVPILHQNHVKFHSGGDSAVTRNKMIWRSYDYGNSNVNTIRQAKYEMDGDGNIVSHRHSIDDS